MNKLYSMFLPYSVGYVVMAVRTKEDVHLGFLLILQSNIRHMATERLIINNVW